MSYNPSLLTAIDRMRLALGDTNSAAELLPDATYTALLAGFAGDETKTTIAAAQALITKYAQEPDKVELDGGKTAAEWKSRLGAWRELAARLQASLDTATVVKTGSGGTRRARRFDDDACGEYISQGREW